MGNARRVLILIHINLDILLYEIVKSKKIRLSRKKGPFYYRNPIYPFVLITFYNFLHNFIILHICFVQCYVFLSVSHKI